MLSKVNNYKLLVTLAIALSLYGPIVRGNISENFAVSYNLTTLPSGWPYLTYTSIGLALVGIYIAIQKKGWLIALILSAIVALNVMWLMTL